MQIKKTPRNCSTGFTTCVSNTVSISNYSCKSKWKRRYCDNEKYFTKSPFHKFYAVVQWINSFVLFIHKIERLASTFSPSIFPTYPKTFNNIFMARVCEFVSLCMKIKIWFIIFRLNFYYTSINIFSVLLFNTKPRSYFSSYWSRVCRFMAAAQKYLCSNWFCGSNGCFMFLNVNFSVKYYFSYLWAAIANI